MKKVAFHRPADTMIVMKRMQRSHGRGKFMSAVDRHGPVFAEGSRAALVLCAEGAVLGTRDSAGRRAARRKSEMRKSRSAMSPEPTAIVTNGKKCAQGREKLKLNAGLAGAGMMYSLSEAVPTKASGSLLGGNAKTERAPGEKKNAWRRVRRTVPGCIEC